MDCASLAGATRSATETPSAAARRQSVDMLGIGAFLFDLHQGSLADTGTPRKRIEGEVLGFSERGDALGHGCSHGVFGRWTVTA